MSHEGQPASQTAAGRLAVKLQAFFDLLPDDEKRIMVQIVRLAVERGDVEGYAAGDAGLREANSDTPGPETDSPNPIDDFRANLGLYLGPDA